jgi:hypothetical protein
VESVEIEDVFTAVTAKRVEIGVEKEEIACLSITESSPILVDKLLSPVERPLRISIKLGAIATDRLDKLVANEIERVESPVLKSTKFTEVVTDRLEIAVLNPACRF